MAKKVKWGTLSHLQNLIDEYFKNEKHPTITGLCLHLGISKSCMKYYTSEKWRTHRKTPAEIEAIESARDSCAEDGIFEDCVEISPDTYILDDSAITDSDSFDNPATKAVLSKILSEAKVRVEVSVIKTMLTAKNPSGAIFYAKAALGYRESAPTDNNYPIPKSYKIVLNVLPSSTKIKKDNDSKV